jgi:hypothetical protein
MSPAQTEEPLNEPRLREAAKRHRMTYHIFTAWGPDTHFALHKVGFEVELYGSANPDAPSEEPRMSDPARRTTYDALRAMAEWALDRRGHDEDVCFVIDAYDGRVVHEPAMDRWAVEVIAHVLRCSDPKRPLTPDEDPYVHAVAKRMASVGVSER